MVPRSDKPATAVEERSKKVAQGQALPRRSWHGVNPRTKAVPAKKGRKVPYCRQTRRKGEVAQERSGE